MLEEKSRIGESAQDATAENHILLSFAFLRFHSNEVSFSEKPLFPLARLPCASANKRIRPSLSFEAGTAREWPMVAFVLDGGLSVLSQPRWGLVDLLQHRVGKLTKLQCCLAPFLPPPHFVLRPNTCSFVSNSACRKVSSDGAQGFSVRSRKEESKAQTFFFLLRKSDFVFNQNWSTRRM